MALHTFTVGNNIRVTVNLPALEEAILADQVVSPADWVEGFANHISAKINRHRQKIIDPEIAAAREAGTINQLPATDDALVQVVFARPGYENRARRDAEAKERMAT